VLIVGLRGLGPSFGISCANQKNPTLPALSAKTRVAQAAVSPEAVLGDARTMFLHPEGYVICFLQT